MNTNVHDIEDRIYCGGMSMPLLATLGRLRTGRVGYRAPALELTGILAHANRSALLTALCPMPDPAGLGGATMGPK